MTTTKITYEQLFPLAQYSNVRLGIEITITQYDNIQEAFDKAKNIIESNFNRLFPQVVQLEQPLFYDSPPISPINDEYGQVAQPKSQKSRVEVLAQNIELVKTIEELNSWKLLVSKNPELQPAFDKKMEELSK